MSDHNPDVAAVIEGAVEASSECPGDDPRCSFDSGPYCGWHLIPNAALITDAVLAALTTAGYAVVKASDGNNYDHLEPAPTGDPEHRP